MTLPTHLAFGLIIGKLTGNYPVAVAAAIAVDLDHLIPFSQNGVLWNPRKLWHMMTDRFDSLGTPRYILHNVFVVIALCIGAFLVDVRLGAIVSLAYASHILLDAADDTIYHPFYPNTSINIRGPLKYFTVEEVELLGLLLLLWATI